MAQPDHAFPHLSLAPLEWPENEEQRRAPAHLAELRDGVSTAGLPRSLDDLLTDLPPAAEESAVFPELEHAVRAGAATVVVIDDDPTGTQTVYDTRVLLDWDLADLEQALSSGEPLFFLLTNSRSLPASEAERLNEQIGRQLMAARADLPFVVVSRSDSTLRGHYPGEILALQSGLGQTFDGHLIVPAFFEGGRYTIGDVHWVATPEPTSRTVVPASSTPFARDAVFGYSSAHLPTWVAEKSRGRWSPMQVQSVSLEVVRDGPTAVSRRLQQVGGGVPVIVNAATYGDLAVFVLGLLQAEARGKRFLYRTAASFVRLRAGLTARPLLTAESIVSAAPSDAAAQGLVVVGSYVPASSAQLEKLLEATELPLEPIELNVRLVLADSMPALGPRIDAALDNNKLPVLFTSRELVRAEDSGDAEQNLAIGRRVTQALLAALAQVQKRPRFVVAKGGITSHEVARRGLGARRATALGQILPGVPVWRLEHSTGDSQMRFPGVPYIVFPGNVGGPDALLQVVRLLSSGA
jgi:uncharacterized protein YgbK (DUF1537 family)